MNMRRLLTITLLFTALQGYAQSVSIIKDPRIDMLLKKQAELNKQVEKLNNKTGPGYRVMVINTNDRTKALEVKSKMMSEYPDHKSYLVYQSPYFKIQVGNFRTRGEAEDLRKRIVRLYPNGVMVVPATVEYKIEKEEEEE
jgi:hypothetical protein